MFGGAGIQYSNPRLPTPRWHSSWNLYSHWWIKSISNFIFTNAKCLLYLFKKLPNGTQSGCVNISILRYEWNNAAATPMKNTLYNGYTISSSQTYFYAQFTTSSSMYKMSCRYIVVASELPYHFNIMNNYALPASSVTNPTNLTFPISYTYRFTSPASSYNIIIYISCLTLMNTGDPALPAMANLTYSITSNTTFNIYLEWGTDFSQVQFHLTIIVYDQDQLRRGFKLYYTRVNWTSSAANSL
jgi:hypothetical protein